MQESEEITVKARDYFPLLGLLAAGILGMSMMCGAAVVGIDDINNAVSIGTPTQGIVDFVISNMSTMIVQTVQALSVPEINTVTLTATSTATNTETHTATSYPTINLFVPTKTLLPPQHSNGTSTPAPAHTSTATFIPKPTSTKTPKPAATNTDVPVPTFTPIPNTDTPIPADTPTDIPPTDVPTIPPTSYP